MRRSMRVNVDDMLQRRRYEMQRKTKCADPAQS
jgi:hypothetical protein